MKVNRYKQATNLTFSSLTYLPSTPAELSITQFSSKHTIFFTCHSQVRIFIHPSLLDYRPHTLTARTFCTFLHHQANHQPASSSTFSTAIDGHHAIYRSNLPPGYVLCLCLSFYSAFVFFPVLTSLHYDLTRNLGFPTSRHFLLSSSVRASLSPFFTYLQFCAWTT